MTASMETLPPRPDFGPPQVVAPAPKKRRVWPIIGSVVGGLIVLGAISNVLDPQDTSTPTTTTPTTSISEARGEAAPLLNQVADELDQITRTSAVSADIVHINAAAGLLEQAASILDGIDDTSAMYLHSASDHMYNAASSWPDAASVREVNAASDDISAAQAAL